MIAIGSTRLPDYLTVEETAEVLGYHPNSVRKMVRAGKLRAEKKGTMWLIYREALEEYQKAIEGKSKHDPTRGQ
ncbi:MAG: helix-turn-helix domain-containing protein [Chloroflexi bacterium]|nr:helix-turn-helix domain-containing protein [Chloroflexota bacterium]